MSLNTFKASIKNFGLPKAVAEIALHAANRVVILRILKGIRIEHVNPAFLECDPKYRGLFLTEPMLREFAADPKNELSHAFLDQALAKGDECYGFVAGASLAAYGWYSTEPTELDLPGLRLSFSDQYVYMYKGFTAADHRGKRLHAIGMTRALQAYLQGGYRGIISYVEWDNFGSLKSCYRMGYRDFGHIAIGGWSKQYVLYHDAGCRKYAFFLERTRASEKAWIPAKLRAH